MAAHRRLDQRRDDLSAGGLRKRESSIASALDTQSLCHCHVERKSGRIRRVNYWQTGLAILAALSGRNGAMISS
jgi:hypothetical protein